MTESVSLPQVLYKEKGVVRQLRPAPQHVVRNTHCKNGSSIWCKRSIMRCVERPLERLRDPYRLPIHQITPYSCTPLWIVCCGDQKVTERAMRNPNRALSNAISQGKN